jgi:hypothetical protein
MSPKKEIRNKGVGLCAAAVIIFCLIAVLPQTVCALNVTYEGPGNGTQIYSRSKASWTSAFILEMNVSGTIYDAYCIDLYTSISKEDNLTVNGSLSEGNPNINWTAVSYILYTYDYSSAGDKNLEAAAIQAAIWYYCTEEYGEYPGAGGKHQFMTDDTNDTYDAYLRFGEPRDSVRDRAFVIINDTKENGTDFKFPTRIELNASEEYVLQGQTINLTATVYDQTDAPIHEGVTVKFAITEGNGTLDPDNGTTNDTGQVQINFTGTDANATRVVAWVEGSYGTLLRGDILYVEPVQNVSTITLIPRSIEGSIVLPIPEQSTIVLTSTGVLALMGYVAYSSRRKKEE